MSDFVGISSGQFGDLVQSGQLISFAVVGHFLPLLVDKWIFKVMCCIVEW